MGRGFEPLRGHSTEATYESRWLYFLGDLRRFQGGNVNPRCQPEIYKQELPHTIKVSKSPFVDFLCPEQLKYALEDVLGREVDLLEEQAIRNPYLKENIDRTKALMYG